MTREEFMPEMNRLLATFGKGAYPDERIKLIYATVGALPVEALRSMVTTFIAELRQAPLVPEVREAANRERERLWGIQKKQKLEKVWSGVSNCGRCHDTGAFPARIEGQLGAYAFKCTCPAGKSDRRNYPEWGSISGDWQVTG